MKPMKEKYATHSLVSTLLTGILTSVHHAYEIGYLALALVLAVVVLPALSMQRFRQTGSKAALWVYRLLTAWLVIGFGLADGLWNHVIKPLGFYYVLLPTHGGDAKVVERIFSILPPVVGSFLYEGTGILTFVASLFAAYYGYKFTRVRKQFESINKPLAEFNMSNFIQLKQVSKWFESAAGRFTALRNIDLTIAQGEHVAIVGKSGSGKSTLLNMLTGIDHPSQGIVIINNTEVHTLNESRLAAWRGTNIGIVFQFFQLIPTLSIMENLLLAMDFVNLIPRKERKQRAEKLLAQVGIAPHANKLPASLSGGEQQRAAVARALANNPPILVADEPTGNLDGKTTEAIQKLFVDLGDDGKTVIVVTHEDVSDSVYDRIITLHDGAITDDQRKSRQRMAA